MATNLDTRDSETGYERLRKAVLEYISEIDNPVPDALYRHTLRERLRELVGAPPAPRC